MRPGPLGAGVCVRELIRKNNAPNLITNYTWEAEGKGAGDDP